MASTLAERLRQRGGDPDLAPSAKEGAGSPPATMRRLASLALLLALSLASVPTASAQLGGLINRARAAVSGSSSAPSASTTATVDYARFMNTRFFPAQGTFLFGTSNAAGGYMRGDDHIIFPPESIERYDEIGSYVLRRSDGTIIGQQTATYDDNTQSAVFIEVGTSGAPQWSGAVENGHSYSLDLMLGREVVGTVPFTARVVENGDPFNPTSTVVLEGPWRTHAFFQHETERPDYLMHFYAWVGPDEAGSNVKTEVSIRRNGQEVAWGHGGTNTTYGWGPVQYRLFDTGTRHATAGFGRSAANATSWTIEEVTPGPYEIVLMTEDGPFRTMTIEGASGAFVPHARSSMEYQPRSLFLTPRRIDRTGQSALATSAYWIAPPVE